MNIQIIGTRKSADTRRAERFFRERGIPFHFVDLAERALSRGELEHIAGVLPLDGLVDRDGARYARRGLAHLELDLFEELLEDPLLLRTPIVRFGREASVGANEEIWRRWAAEVKHG